VTNTPPEKKPTFEQALGRLEEIVARLEQGEETLESAMSLFEEGMRMARLCQQQLQEAQGKIEKLVETARGQVKTEEMKPEDLRG
jgi:exodeoxyribonuclease VII small subunit